MFIQMLKLRPRHWLTLASFILLLFCTQGVNVGITYVTDAVTKGAVCLDGSPAAYHLDNGFGTGANSWLIHFEGGGWCNNITSCLRRKGTRLGSSKLMGNQLAFFGILNNLKQYNPDFYNWNRVKIRYCDGSSYTGDVEEVNPVTNLHFRGARIWVAVIEELLSKGMINAENALLSGCSAGGLAAILHCDNFRSLLPMGTRVKCLSDAGYFIEANDVSGAPYIQDYFDQIVTLHGSGKNLPLSCSSRMNPGNCFFPENVVPLTRTPVFILNAAYDSWQIRNILAPDISDPRRVWSACKQDINSCSPDEIQVMQGYRLQFLRALNKSIGTANIGFFISSCFIHCQTEMQERWYMLNSPMLNKTKVATAVGDWFYDQFPFQKIDCPYPCNPTCINQVYEPSQQPPEV